MSKDHLAKEAARLRDDGILNDALDAMRREAYEALAKADADDKTQVLRLQQKVAVINEFTDTLEAFIMNAQSADVKRGFV